MRYTTYFLKFADQAEEISVMESIGYRKTEEFEGESFTHYHIHDAVGDIDIVGDIYNNDGVYDEETGDTITPPTKKTGWHVNIIIKGELKTELITYIVDPTPVTPARVFYN